MSFFMCNFCVEKQVLQRIAGEASLKHCSPNKSEKIKVVAYFPLTEVAQRKCHAGFDG